MSKSIINYMKYKIQKLSNRSGLSKCDICQNEEILEIHHIRGRKIPNCNNPSNLANICSNCHTKVHHGIIVIEDWVMTTDGYQLIWHYYKDKSITGNDAKPWLIK